MEDPDGILDQDMLRTLVETRRAGSNQETLHLYYSPQNAIDTLVANSFAGIPNTLFYPVESPLPEPQTILTAHSSPITATTVMKWLLTEHASSHRVVKLLDDKGLLAAVFRQYL